MAEKKQWMDHYGPVFNRVGEFDVIECEPCGFKHIIPIPSVKALAEIYRDDYYSTEKPLYFERYQEDLEWWKLTYGKRYEIFEEILPSGRRRILDVGSGPGIFLQCGGERGWETVGIEPSRQAAQYTRDLGLKVVEEFLGEENVEAVGRFDVVHMSQVLEHIPDPRGMLNLCKRVLLPEGLLCIVIPNDYNPFQEALTTVCGFEPWWIAPPHHINYFSFESIDRLLAKSGFDVVVQTATFPIDMFLLMGDNYIGDDELGRECHKKRKRFEQNLVKAGKDQLMKKLYSVLADLKLGREIQIVARKK